MSRPLLMIPGPTEFSPDVLNSLGEPTDSHVSPSFINVYGETLEMLRSVFLAPTAQPIVVSGSGMLSWDLAIANVIERGDKVAIVNTGYFGDTMGQCAECFGASTVHVRAPKIGDCPSAESLAEALRKEESAGTPVKLVTITHVDTSTGVRTDVPKLIAHGIDGAGLVHRPLVLVDGVCASAAEELRMDEWGVDLVCTASQKALGVPPGLAVLMVSKRALEVNAAMSSPVPSYFCRWTHWIPIMKNYEARKPSYFATPPVNLIKALHTSLREWGLSAGGAEGQEEVMMRRFRAHDLVASRVRKVVAEFGLSPVPVRDELCGNTITPIYYPEGIDGAKLRAIMKREGVVVAGGLHKDIKATYFRIGHMGVSSTDPRNQDDVPKTMKALETALKELGLDVPGGVVENVKFHQQE